MRYYVVKLLLLCGILLMGQGHYVSKMVSAYTQPLVTNSGISYPISLDTGRDAKGKQVFPDREFLEYIKKEKFTTGKYSGYEFDLDEDGSLSQEECDTVRIISISGRTEIKSIAGIEAFPKLRELYCSDTGIETLDLTNSPRLQILFCADNAIKALDVSRCPLLKDMNVSGCQLASLNLAGNTELSFLTCNEQSRSAGEYREGDWYKVQLADLDAGMELSRISHVELDGAPGDSVNSGYDEETGTVYCSDEMQIITYEYTMDLGGIEGESVAKTMTITLNLTTGWREAYDTEGGSIVLPQFFANGEKDKAPQEPKKDGCRFTGWYLDKEKNRAYPFENVLADNLTLYAGWEQKHYQVRYESGDSALNRKLPAKTVDWWSTGLIPTGTEAPKRQGYILTGWQTAEGRAVTENNAATVSYGDLAGDSNLEGITLTAVWEEDKSYSLNLDVASAGLKKKVENMPYFSEKTVFAWNDRELLAGLWEPRVPGYDFAGWYTHRTGGVQVTNDMAYCEVYEACFGNSGEGQTPTLYAQFTIRGYTIYYDEKGGSRVPDRTNVLWGSGNLLPAKKTQKKNYVFVGWKLDGKKITKKTKLNFDSCKYNNSLTLTAIWKKKYEKKGTIFKRYGCSYKVIRSNKKGNRVKLVAVARKKVTIRNQVFLNGKYFKVTAIKKKALKKIKEIHIRVPKKQLRKYRRMVKRAGGKKKNMI